MQKQKTFLLEGHRSTFLGQKHKSAIWNRTRPHLHIKPSIYVCRRVQGSQIFKQNWIILIHLRVIVILLIWVSSALGGVGQVGEGCPGWSTIVYMSSGMFRGKESLSRIKLSQLVQELLNFEVLGSLWLWGWGGWMWVGVVGCGWGWLGVGGCGWGWLGVPRHTCTHTCMHAHAHACTCMCGKHDNFMQMATPIGGIHGNSLWCHTHVCVHACVCVCMHACVCACVWGTPFHHPHPIHPSPDTQGDPQNQSKFNSTWTNQDISILFEDLKSVETLPPMGGCIVWWVGEWVGGLMGGVRWVFCLMIYDLETLLFDDLWFVETPMGGCGCVGGWMDGWVNGWGQVKWLNI